MTGLANRSTNGPVWEGNILAIISENCGSGVVYKFCTAGGRFEMVPQFSLTTSMNSEYSVPKFLNAATFFLVMSSATSVFADDIELDWDSIELGFFENANEAGEILHGLVVYVPSNRLATEDDFHAIVPDFCGSRVAQLLEFSAGLENAPDVSLLKLQLDFHGPKIGENETYIARSATIDLDDGQCSL